MLGANPILISSLTKSSVPFKNLLNLLYLVKAAGIPTPSVAAPITNISSKKGTMPPNPSATKSEVVLASFSFCLSLSCIVLSGNFLLCKFIMLCIEACMSCVSTPNIALLVCLTDSCVPP